METEPQGTPIVDDPADVSWLMPYPAAYAAALKRKPRNPRGSPGGQLPGRRNEHDFRVVRSGSVLEVSVLKHRYWPPGVLEPEQARWFATRRSMRELQRKVSSNVGQWSVPDGFRPVLLFVTLSFRDGVLPHVNRADIELSDIHKAKSMVSACMRRVNWSMWSDKRMRFKWTYVMEFGQHDGRLHFHMLIYNWFFRSDYKAFFEERWRNGFVRVDSNVREALHVGRYLSKYMTKDFERTYQGERVRLHSSSIRLHRPIVYGGDDAAWWYQRLQDFPPWYYQRGRLVNDGIWYLGRDGLPEDTHPPYRPSWLGSHEGMPVQQSGYSVEP